MESLSLKYEVDIECLDCLVNWSPMFDVILIDVLSNTKKIPCIKCNK